MWQADKSNKAISYFIPSPGGIFVTRPNREIYRVAKIEAKDPAK